MPSFFDSWRLQLVSILLTGGLLTHHGQATAQAPVKQWDKTFGGTQIERLTSVVQTTDGGYLVGGSSQSDNNGDKSQPNRGESSFSDFWILKLDAAGNKVWDKTFGSRFWDELQALQQTPDGGYVLGGYSFSDNATANGDKTQGGYANGYDYWLIRLDAQGNKLWDKTFGGEGEDRLYDLQLTPDGGYLLGGYSNSGPSPDKTQASKGLTDYWLIKVDAQGNKVWDKTLGGNGVDNLQSLCATSDGGYLVGGHSNSDISGDKSENSRGTLAASDYWVVKLDATGNKQWDRTYGSASVDVLNSLQQTHDGGYILGGTASSVASGDKSQDSKALNDYWVVKLDASGNKQWDRSLGGYHDDNLYALQQTSDEGYVLGGYSRSGIGGDKTQGSRGDTDFWVVKLDAQGNLRWDLTLGGNSTDNLYALQQTTDGGYVLGGYSLSEVSGEKSQPFYGTFAPHDYWLVKLSPEKVLATLSSAGPHPLTVYPNPATEHLTLRLPRELVGKPLRLVLRDVTGHPVFAQSVPITQGDEVSLRIGQQKAGLYQLYLTGPNDYWAIQRVVLTR